MKENPLPCPRCNSKMEELSIPGNMRSFPSVALACISKDCLWNIQVTYDELAGKRPEDVMEKLIKQWNEGINAK